MRTAAFFCLLFVFLTACQPSVPENIFSEIGTEFTLAPSQTVVVTDAGVSITLVGMGGDERCPSEIECAMSGPVSLTISIHEGSNTPVNFDLQTFTSNNGRAPELSFEGIESQIEVGDHIIRVTGVLPYPSRSADEIKDSQYRVSFIVQEK